MDQFFSIEFTYSIGRGATGVLIHPFNMQGY